MQAALAFLLLAIATPAAPDSVEGDYDVEMMETASGLQLLPGGRYRWFFSQGALDLESEGEWVREGDRILLTSDPFVAPRFVYVGRVRSGAAGFVVRVTGPQEKPLQGVDILVQYPERESDAGYSDVEGIYRFVNRGGPASIAIALPMFGLRSEDFQVQPERGDSFTFRLEPNGLGKEKFERLPLAVVSDGLEMTWRGPSLRYRRSAR